MTRALRLKGHVPPLPCTPGRRLVLAAAALPTTASQAADTSLQTRIDTIARPAMEGLIRAQRADGTFVDTTKGTVGGIGLTKAGFVAAHQSARLGLAASASRQTLARRVISRTAQHAPRRRAAEARAPARAGCRRHLLPARRVLQQLLARQPRARPRAGQQRPALRRARGTPGPPRPAQRRYGSAREPWLSAIRVRAQCGGAPLQVTYSGNVVAKG